VNIPSYKPTYKGNAKQVKAAVEKIASAKQPVIYAGGGVGISGASGKVQELSELMQIPVVTTLMAKGAVPESYELNLGLVGMHGSKYANLTLNRCDLIIALGARFSDRVTGKLESFAPNAEVIHVDIDPAEIGKVREANVPIVGDLRNVVESLLAGLKKIDAKPQTDEWLSEIEGWRQRHPVYDKRIGEKFDCIVPEEALAQLSDLLDANNSIVTTEVGQHQMWAAQCIKRDKPHTFITSGGLGTMGFGFPAAIGAALAWPDKTVVCIAGDGSFQMNSQEMATAAIYGANVKVVVVNNRALGMVRQWQKLFYRQRYSASELAPVPDFVKLAEAYGWQGEHVEDRTQVEDVFRRMLAHEGPYLVDLAVPRDQSVFPLVAPGKALSEVMGAIDSQDGVIRIIESADDLTPKEKGEIA